MPRKSSSRKSRIHWLTPKKTLVAIVLLAFAVTVFVLSRNMVSESKSPVSRQWCDEIAKYSIKPVFPPRDDFSIGDLFPVKETGDVSEPRAARWKRLGLDSSKIRGGKALLPEYSVTTSYESDLAALLPWEKIKASVSGNGSKLKSAKIVMEDVTTKSIDGAEVLNALREWDYLNKRSLIKRDYLNDFRLLSNKTTNTFDFAAVTEVYYSPKMRVVVEVSGKATGNYKANLSVGSDSTTRVTVGERSAGSFTMIIEKRFPEPLAIGATGFTYKVNLTDGTFSVDPVVKSGAGSGGLIPAE
jgi:hypothetical protein